MKKDLIDFGIYVTKNDIVLVNGNITETVNDYLKSIQSLPRDEATSVRENEDSGNLCDICGKEPPYSYDVYFKMWICKKCKN